MNAMPQHAYWPTIEWQTCEPEAAGFQLDPLVQMQAYIEDYVAASTRKQSNGGPPVNANYGCLWWIEQVRGMHAFFASGFGGKYIYVMPELDLVVVTTASTQQAYKDPEQHNTIRALIPNFILPALSH